jgi:hypothetical protein
MTNLLRLTMTRHALAEIQWRFGAAIAASGRDGVAVAGKQQDHGGVNSYRLIGCSCR